jgi:hypothetical protein
MWADIIVCVVSLSGIFIVVAVVSDGFKELK